MGCLITQIENRTVCDVKVDTTKKNSNSELSAISHNSLVSVNTKDSHHLVIINSENKNKVVSVGTTGKKPTISINIGLVCRVSLGGYKLFYIEEGPFIVEEGYFKVKGL